MQGGRCDANRDNGKKSRVLRSHGKRPPGPVASVSAAPQSHQRPLNHLGPERGHADDLRGYVHVLCPGLHWLLLLHRRHRSAQPGHQLQSNWRPRCEGLGLVLRSPQHMATESWSDRIIGVRSLPVAACCRPALVLRVVAGFDDHGDPILTEGQRVKVQFVARSGCPERIAVVRNSWLVRSPPSIRLSRGNFSYHSFGSPAVRFMDFHMWRAVGGPVTRESSKSSCVELLTARRSDSFFGASTWVEVANCS